MTKKLTYLASGVNTEEGNRFVGLIKPLVEATHNKKVVKSYGGFSGAYRLADGSYLVASADGVGTKLKIAFSAGRFDTVGIDLVAMCVNDIITCGAEPLFFLDYIATGLLDAEKMTEVVKGISAGCREAGCALLGGETAEMPGFYEGAEFDLAGFAVGTAGKQKFLTPDKAEPGDEIIGIPSSGIHSNGYSLVRKIIFEKSGMSLDSVPDGLSRPLADELLEPTKIYARPLKAVFESFDVRGAAHITGGGLTGNIPRSLPEGLVAVLEKSRWKTPAIFQLLRRLGNLEDGEMFATFNCGIGMTLTVKPEDSDGVVKKLNKNGGGGARIIGKVEKEKGGAKGVIIT